MGSRRKARIIAFQSLYSWEFSKNPAYDLVNFEWLDDEKKENLDEQTATFAKLLLLGTIEKIEEIDRVISRHLKNWDIDRIGKVDLALLRMSVYSILYQNDIPISVSIDEAIDIAKKYGPDESYKFINGVLDAVKKEKLSG